jgi:hypothetical protein
MNMSIMAGTDQVSASSARMTIPSRIHLIPLLADGSGGHRPKIRNGRGDRVIHYSEFMQRLAVPFGE